MLVLWHHFYNCSKCPARNRECNTIHLTKACQSSRNQRVTAVTNSNELCAVLAATPDRLASSTVPIQINNYSASALVDSASSSSIINNELAQILKLKMKPFTRNITLAMSSKQAPSKGVCHVNITLNNKQYKNTCLKGLENLCGDVLLSLDFQKQHAAVTFLHGGTEPELKINEAGIEVCSLITSRLMVPRLFANLKPHAQQIATKPRVYSDEDRQFIA